MLKSLKITLKYLKIKKRASIYHFIPQEMLNLQVEIQSYA